MLEKLKLVEERYMEMEARAAQPDLYADPTAAAKLLKEQRQLEPVVTAYRAYMARDQIPEDYALRRIRAQEPDEFYRANCRYVLENAGTDETLFIKKANSLLNLIIKENEP